MTVYPPCAKKYIAPTQSAEWRLNAIPIQQVSIPEIPDGALQMYFPRPWVLVGLVTLDESSATSISYPASLSRLITPAKHGTYRNMLNNIFLDLAFANTHEFSNLYTLNYLRPGNQGTDYRGYFSKYLNQQTLLIENLNDFYNSIIQPESIMNMFFTKNAAAAADLWYERWKETVEFLEKTMHITLMGAPGVYTIGQGGGRSEPNWNGQTFYQTFENA